MGLDSERPGPNQSRPGVPSPGEAGKGTGLLRARLLKTSCPRRLEINPVPIFAGIFSLKQRVPSRVPSGPASVRCPDRAPVRESVRTGPRPHRPSSSDVGPWTLDLGLAGRCPVSPGNDCPGTAARTANASATSQLQPTYRAQSRPRNPAFLRVWKQLRKFPRSKARLATEKEMPGRPAAVEWAGEGLSHPVGAQEGPNWFGPGSQACAALRPGL